MERPLRIALVSREVYPFVLGGGLGRYVSATAETLAPIAEVTIFTSDLHEERFEELRAAGSPDLLPGVRYVFVPEPREADVGAFYHHLHCWSARVLDALHDAYADQPPDLVEFPDYLGEGCVTVQAKQTLDPLVRRAAVCVRLYTPSEMTSVPGDPTVGVAALNATVRGFPRMMQPGRIVSFEKTKMGLARNIVVSLSHQVCGVVTSALIVVTVSWAPAADARPAIASARAKWKGLLMCMVLLSMGSVQVVRGVQRRPSGMSARPDRRIMAVGRHVPGSTG